MSVIKFLRDWTDLFNWSTDENPTTQQDYQEAVKNWIETERNIVDTLLWQPDTEYAIGDMVKTPSISSQYCLVCTTAGTSGANEPTYSDVSIGDTVTDGTVTWTVAKNESVNSSGTLYIRYDSGLQICWGTVTGSGDASGTTVTFPVAFSSTPVVTASANSLTANPNHVSVQVGTLTTTGCSVAVSVNVSWTSAIVAARWIAIGYWK